MRRHNRLLPILFALLALGTTTAPICARDEVKKPKQGGEAENPYVRRFKELDADGDGYVSLDEWPLEEAKFHLVDRNKDGRLSRNELLTPNVLRRDPFEARFRALDGDRDGRLSRSELERGGEGLDRSDRNRDGSVTLLEYRNGFENTWHPRATFPDQRRFQNLDRNRDNRLSRLEFHGPKADFDRLDRNRDGVLSPREWQ